MVESVVAVATIVLALGAKVTRGRTFRGSLAALTEAALAAGCYMKTREWRPLATLLSYKAMNSADMPWALNSS
jgi:hypothetical protein